jgi:hypothetical protein
MRRRYKKKLISDTYDVIKQILKVINEIRRLDPCLHEETYKNLYYIIKLCDELCLIVVNHPNKKQIKNIIIRLNKRIGITFCDLKFIDI